MPFLIAVVLGLAAIAAAVVFWYVTVPIAAILASVAIYRSSRFSPVMRGRIAGGLVILAVLTGGVGAAIHLGGTPAQSAGARSIPASPFPTVAGATGNPTATSALTSDTSSSPPVSPTPEDSQPASPAAPTETPAEQPAADDKGGCQLSHEYWGDLPKIIDDFKNQVETSATTSRKLINMRHDIENNDILAAGDVKATLDALGQSVGKLGVAIADNNASELVDVIGPFNMAVAVCKTAGAF